MGLYDGQLDLVYDIQAPAAATATVKAAPGIVRSFIVTNRNAAARYLLLFDATSGTTDASIRASFLIPPLSLGGQIGVGADHLGKAGLVMAAGITYGISTSSSTYSAATSTESDLFIRYL